MKIKKFLSGLLAVLLIFSLTTSSQSASAASPSENGFTINLGTGYLTAYSGPGGDVVIPSTIGGYNVTGIENNAFMNNTTLTSITIPSSIIYIALYAFNGCTNLTAIHVDSANSVYSSEDGVLYNKNKTELILCPTKKSGSITIPASVSSIYTPLNYCPKLTEIIVDTNNSQYSSENGVLFNKAKTTLITYPCARSGSFAIPDGFTTIDTNEFRNCTALTALTIPSSVTNISPNSLTGCSNLSSIVTDSNNPVYSSENGILYNKDKTTLITYPAAKGNVIIPDHVATINASAFFNNVALTSIIIPGSVTTIGDSAFSFCFHLSSVYFLGGSAPSITKTPMVLNDSFNASSPTFYYINGSSGYTWSTYSLVALEPAAMAVAIDKLQLAIGYAAGDSVASVTQNLILPITGSVTGSAITWSSDNAAVTTVSGSSIGLVTRPAYESGDSNVVLTATIASGGVSDTKSFSLTVTKLPQVIIPSPGSSGGSGSVAGGGSGSGAGGGTASGSDTGLPKIEGSTIEGWDAISKSISDAAGSITVNMNKSTVIPKELLSALQGKDSQVTFALANGIEWAINGKDIPDSADSSLFSNIDLNINLNTDSIPSNVLSSVAGTDASNLQFTLAHEGSFGFTAVIRFPLGKTNNGKIANLFYYNPTTKHLELQSIGLINKDGDAELQFTHASDYVIVISDQAMLSDAAEQITIKPDKQTLYYGGTKDKSVKLSVTLPTVIEEAVADMLCETSVSYESSNPQVASVSGSGLVSAGKAGKTTITTTVTVDGVKKSFQTLITVKKAYIKLTKKTSTLKLGEAFTFHAVGYGVDTQNIIFKTTKKSILVINKKTGAATAKSIGTDYVLASVGDISVKFKVTVN